ncbi:MAG: hypothetical protein SV760_04740 [Halobacteria archaeon]|nr:hypothetical protein [Halobacteria archaeon]
MSSFDSDLRVLATELDSACEGIRPDELRRFARRSLTDRDRTPAYLYLLSARLSDTPPDFEEATGFHLIHTGLGITRDVVNDPSSWEEIGVEHVEEDMKLLAADVLVTLGFDYLLERYGTATRIVNEFGSSKAKAREIDADASFDSALSEEAAEYLETYTAAVSAGYEGEPPEHLVSLAESLAYVNCIEESEKIRKATESDEYLKEKRERARESAELLDGFREYVEALLNGTENTDGSSGIEVRTD